MVQLSKEGDTVWVIANVIDAEDRSQQDVRDERATERSRSSEHTERISCQVLRYLDAM